MGQIVVAPITIYKLISLSNSGCGDNLICLHRENEPGLHDPSNGRASQLRGLNQQLDCATVRALALWNQRVVLEGLRSQQDHQCLHSCMVYPPFSATGTNLRTGQNAKLTSCCCIGKTALRSLTWIA